MYNIVQWLIPHKCKHSRTELLKGVSSPDLLCSPTASVRLDSKRHFKTLKPGTRQWSAQNCPKWKKHHPVTGAKWLKTKRGGCTHKRGRKGNQSLVTVIVQRRAFVLQTHHCESAWHWSPGLKPHLFGINVNKVFSAGYQPVFLFLSSYIVRKIQYLHTVFVVFGHLKNML